jgi:hypothetical protein
MTPATTLTDFEISILVGLAWIAFLSLVVVILIYGLLTPWWRSRTGIGFMSTKVAFGVAIGLSLARYHGHTFPTWVYYVAWVLIILSINLGITWNIVYKQFFQHRGDEVADKSADHLIQTGVKHGLLTGEIPIQQGEENDRGIPR